MKAKECNVEELYAGRVTYVTPSFQRPYRFVQKPVRALVSRLLNRSNESIFLGALVIRELGTPREGTGRKALLMDGNQRLLTLLMVLLAIRDRLRAESPKEAIRLEELCFVHHDKSGPLLKNIVAREDRATFEAILAGNHASTPSGHPPDICGPLSRVYEAGREALRTFSLQNVSALSQHLITHASFVVLSLTSEDDPYPVFRLFNPGNDTFSRRGRAVYTQYAKDPELMDWIAGGESQEVEFKAHSATRGKGDSTDPIQGVGTIVRAVAAMLNSFSGGILLIGVQDDGSICGVEDEYPLVDRGKKNWDGYQLYLANMLRAKLEARSAFLHYSVERRPIHNHDVCLIRISPSDEPVYVAKHLYVRSLNQTIELLGPDLIDFVHRRFHITPP